MNGGIANSVYPGNRVVLLTAIKHPRAHTLLALAGYVSWQRAWTAFKSSKKERKECRTGMGTGATVLGAW